MDLEEFRAIIENSGADIWSFIKGAIRVASQDYPEELKCRRDEIIEKLFQCSTCNNGGQSKERESARSPEVKATHQQSPSTPVSIDGNDEEREREREEEERERRRRRIAAAGFDDDEEEDEDEEENDAGADNGDDDELRRIISIREQFEDPHQTEESLVDLLQSLADMDITFKALKETDIGRYVNRLRKHQSNDVRRLVKILVRKWKDLVDEWVRLNMPGEVQSSSNLMADGDSPQTNISKNHQNGHNNQVPDFAYSPNPHNGSFGSDRNHPEAEQKPKTSSSVVPAHRRDPPAKPSKSPSVPASAPPPNRQKQVLIDPDRLASARKRLQENYQEANNAKKQRTIQVMDIHEFPKPRNGYIAKNKGGFQRH